MKVVIIGSGNVATVLARRMFEEGVVIEEVVSRNLGHAKTLAVQVDARALSDLNEITRTADLYLIAVPDAQIAQVAGAIQLKDNLIVHTAGSVSMEVLAGSSVNYGVVYPLQTLRKEISYIPPIPILIDANSNPIKEQLDAFAETWAHSVLFANDEQRLKTHVAAVFASNFTNHLYKLTEDYCKSEGLAFRSLLPLIQEVASRIETLSPADVQTGPATRRDYTTIRKHIGLLENYPKLSQAYSFLTSSILGGAHLETDAGSNI